MHPYLGNTIVFLKEVVKVLFATVGILCGTVGVAGVVGLATLASTEVSVRVSRSSNASSPGVENPGLQSTGVLERSLAFSTENSSSVMRPSSRSSFRFRSNDGLFAMHDCMEMDHLSDEVSPRSHRLLQTHVQAHVNVDYFKLPCVNYVD